MSDEAKAVAESEVKAAAERLRRYLEGKPDSEGAMPTVTFNEVQLLAELYLAEHQSDDAQGITHQWFRTLPEWRADVGRVIVGQDAKYELGLGAWFVFLDYGPSNTVPLPHIQTRGQLRQLLRALGVSDE